MHWGNQRFRAMIDAELPAYTDAQECKRQKSVIIGRVLADIQHHSPHAGFVKKDVASGRWLSLTDAASRVTIAQAFRDALVGTYRSSKHSKQVKRRIEKRDKHVPKRVSRTENQPPQFLDTFAEEPNFKFTSMPSLTNDSGFHDSFGVTASIVADIVSDDEDSCREKPEKRTSEFDALFAAFDKCEVNLEDNPFEPLPLASSPAPQEIEPLPLYSPRRTSDVVKYNDVSCAHGSFGSSVPFRDVRAAMSA